MRINKAVYFEEMAAALLNEGSSLSFRAGGKSMSPFIRDNEMVIIEPLAGKLRIGDVILFSCHGRKLMLHRIVKKDEAGYITRGDASCHHDGIVAHGSVLGRAVHVIGGLNFHLRFPLSALVALVFRLRERPRLFNMLRVPGSLLLRSLRIGSYRLT